MAIKGRQLIAVTGDHEYYETVIIIDPKEYKQILKYNQGVCDCEYDDKQAMQDMHRRLEAIGYINCPVEHFEA